MKKRIIYVLLLLSFFGTIKAGNLWWTGLVSSNLNDSANWVDRDAATGLRTPTGDPRDVVRIGAHYGSEDFNDNNIFDPGEDVNGNGIFDTVAVIGWGGYTAEEGGIDLDVDPVLSETYVSSTGTSEIGWLFVLNAPNRLTLEDGAFLILNKKNGMCRNGGVLEIQGRSDSDGPSLIAAKDFRISENGSNTLAKDEVSQLIINGTGWMQIDPALDGSGPAFRLGMADTMPRGEIIIEEKGILELLENTSGDQLYLDFGQDDPAVNQIIIRQQGQLILYGDMDSIARVGDNDSIFSLQQLIDNKLIVTDMKKGSIQFEGTNPTIVTAKLNSVDHYWHGSFSSDLNDPQNWTDRDASTAPTTPTGNSSKRDIVRIGAGWGSEDLNDNDILDEGEDINGNSILDTLPMQGWGSYLEEEGAITLAQNPVLSETYVSRNFDSNAGWFFILNSPNSLTLEDGAHIVFTQDNCNLRNGGLLEIQGRSDSGGPSLISAHKFRIAENGSNTLAKDEVSRLYINGTGWMQIDPKLKGTGAAFMIGMADTMPRGEILIEDTGRLELLMNTNGDQLYLDFGTMDSTDNQIILADKAQLWLAGDMDSVGRVGSNDSIFSLQALMDHGLISSSEDLTIIGTNPTIVVAGEVVYVDSIKVNAPADSVIAGSSMQMSALVYPDTADIKDISWSVKNGTGNATINESGLLSGVSAGTVTVVATALGGSGVKDSMDIEIISLVLVNSITVNADASTVDKKATLQMTANVEPENADNRDVAWSVTKGTGDATIDENGLLTGVAAGTVTVVATALDGSAISGSKEITVNKSLVTSIVVIANPESVDVGATLQLSTSIIPSDADNKDVTWSVTKGTGDATIDASGLLTGVSAGTVTAVATAADGSNVTGSLEITVTATDGIESLSNTLFKVYPNPSSGLFNIELESMHSTYVVYDITGSVIISDVISGNYHTLDISQYEKGMYILRITSGNLSEYSILVVE